MAAGRLHLGRPRSMTIPVGAAATSTPRAGADTRGIGPLWALLAEIGRSEGNSQSSLKFRGKFTRLTQKPYCNSYRFTVTYAYESMGSASEEV